MDAVPSIFEHRAVKHSVELGHFFDSLLMADGLHYSPVVANILSFVIQCAICVVYSDTDSV